MALAALVVAVPSHAATERPLVYVVVIDGLDGDRVEQGTAPYISSLLAGQGDAYATYYEESRALIIAETNPNHVAMMTGAYTDRSGTAGNGYGVYAPVEENTCRTTGPKDFSRPPTLTSGEDASCLIAESVFESIKRQSNPDDLLTAGIFGKPKLGAIFAGENVDRDELHVDHLWAPCSGSLEYDEEYCDAEVERNPATGYAIDDAAVMDEVLRTMEEGVAREGEEPRRPDLTFVNLPQVDSAGHAFTPSGPYDAAIAMADEEIRRLVEALKERGEWQRSVVIVLSDHSMDASLNKTNLSDVLEAQGIDPSTYTVIGNGSAAMLYLSDRTAGDRFELLKRIRAAALSSPNVAEALYREPNPEDGGAEFTIDGVHPGWHAAGERTGDLLAMHVPGGAFLDTGEASNPLTDVAPFVPGQHGASQTRDNFFAVIGGGPYVRAQSLAGHQAADYDDTLANPHQAENVDPAPTVMGLFGLAAPADNRGRFLTEAFALKSLPGRGKPARPRVRARFVRGGRRPGCRKRRYKALLRPAGGTFKVLLGSRGKRRTLARETRRARIGFRVREGRRYRLIARQHAASGKFSRRATHRIDLRRAC